MDRIGLLLAWVLSVFGAVGLGVIILAFGLAIIGFVEVLDILEGGGKVNVGFILKLQDGVVVGIVVLAMLGLAFGFLVRGGKLAVQCMFSVCFCLLFFLPFPLAVGHSSVSGNCSS